MWLVELHAQGHNEQLGRVVGDRDMLETPAHLWSKGVPSAGFKVVYIVVHEDAEEANRESAIGLAQVQLSLADNLHLAWVEAFVEPGVRHDEIWRVLLTEIEAFAAEKGRTTVMTWGWEPDLVPPGHEALVAAGRRDERIDATTPTARFLVRHGFGLEQVERISRLVLPPVGRRELLRDDARRRTPAEYEVLSWLGPTPERWYDQACELRVVMSTDQPNAGLDLEPEAWGIARLRAHDEIIEEIDRDQLQTYAVHVPSGSVVGWTRIFVDRVNPQVGHQWETLVRSEHRGHGLGMLLKTTNHAALAVHLPSVERLVTGNAAENSHMLAINTALGYQRYARAAMWQKRLGMS